MKPQEKTIRPARQHPIARIAIALSLSLCSGALLAQPGVASADQAYVVPVGGRDITAREALQAVLPEGWYFYIKPQATMQFTISWKAGEKWTDILDAMAHDNEVAVSINWADRGVIISPSEKAAPAMAPAPAPQPAATRPSVTATPTEPPSQGTKKEAKPLPAHIEQPAGLASTPAASTQTQATSTVPASAVGAVRASAPAEAPASTAPVPANPHVAPADAPLQPFEAKAGVSLRTALARYLRQQGYSLEWGVSFEPLVTSTQRYEGESVTQIVSAALIPAHLRAEVYITRTGDKCVFVQQR